MINAFAFSIDIIYLLIIGLNDDYIAESLVIKKILDYLNAKFSAPASANQLPEPRAPPQVSLFDY
ncbi:hypothetical protein GPB2148_2150 [marine gamma proteobacterium HTCC2148]|uniref:Uncharacterized protein n=1 Tax=Candidatus Seongchinamella marina TaxID=2518990 RepID=A0ABT3T042_9GAMM|nr:hypothetical protein GPB2148_2150 [marine gamma proteobacterium HTCC2148]MCX2975625.1 hypothetical protein [Candidatus Seongchinamella marina]